MTDQEKLKRSQRFVRFYLLCSAAAPALLLASRHPLTLGVVLALEVFTSACVALLMYGAIFVEREFWTRLAAGIIAGAGVASVSSVAFMVLGGGQ